MTIHMKYDGDQHCTGLQPNGKTVAVDCDRTGKGEELFPDNLVGTGLAGCMLLSMGGLAKRDGIDISGTEVESEGTCTNGQSRFPRNLGDPVVSSAKSRLEVPVNNSRPWRRTRPPGSESNECDRGTTKSCPDGRSPFARISLRVSRSANE